MKIVLQQLGVFSVHDSVDRAVPSIQKGSCLDDPDFFVRRKHVGLKCSMIVLQCMNRMSQLNDICLGADGGFAAIVGANNRC